MSATHFKLSTGGNGRARRLEGGNPGADAVGRLSAHLTGDRISRCLSCSEPGENQVSAPLLKTKLYVPPTRSELVSRPRLIERIDEGITRDRRLTLISAPAGFGKTTLLSEWAAHCPWPVGWVSLDEGDNDSVRFWAYVVAALRSAAIEMDDVTAPLTQTPGPPPAETALVPLLNQLTEVPGPFILVLDDYHTIDAGSVHRGLSFLLDNPPPEMHLILATRVDPPLPVARLRARGQLTELYESHLRFTPQEATRFLNQVMGLELSEKDVTALERRTEGWIAGLQMAAVSMRGRDDVSAFVDAFAGSHRYILDYLAGEVLREQPRCVRQFLLETAPLDRLTGELCDHVIEAGTLDPDCPVDDSQRMLEYLDQSNLFIVPLDDERRWYRYHRLFADLLRQRLQRERVDLVPELHRRAGEWHEENGLTADAVRHALACRDFAWAARLIGRVAWPMMARCENTTLLEWLDALPDELISSRPELGVARAWALAVAGESEAVECSLEHVDGARVPGEVAAVRAYVATIQGNTEQGIALARRALDLLPHGNPFLRGFLSLNLGIAYSSSGQPDAASQALARAVALGRRAEQPDLELSAMATLGHVQDTQALLHQAMETHRGVLDLARDIGRRRSPIVGMAHLGIGEVLYECNDLESARHHVSEGIRLLEYGRFLTYLLFGHSLRAQLCLAHGDVDGARAAIEHAEGLAANQDLAYMGAVLAGLRARLEEKSGNGAVAVEWARTHRWEPGGDVDRAREAERTAVARILIHAAQSTGRSGGRERTGDLARDLTHALTLLDHLLETAEAAGRTEAVIRILALKALGLQARGEVGRALSALERALSLAEPEGYVRTFIDEGEPMAGLLREALSSEIAPGYAARLLSAYGDEPRRETQAMASLVEPLTDRELEVLRLIVAGLSNGEIAEELFIAVSTVKSHINHIYGKLAVENRVQAANRARSEGLV